MSDNTKEPVQAMPEAAQKAGAENATGRTGAGESGGGAYKDNAYKDKGQVKGDPDNQGFMKHGGQSHIDYSGPGDAEDYGDNPNATTGG